MAAPAPTPSHRSNSTHRDELAQELRAVQAQLASVEDIQLLSPGTRDRLEETQRQLVAALQALPGTPRIDQQPPTGRTLEQYINDSVLRGQRAAPLQHEVEEDDRTFRPLTVMLDPARRCLESWRQKRANAVVLGERPAGPPPRVFTAPPLMSPRAAPSHGGDLAPESLRRRVRARVDAVDAAVDAGRLHDEAAGNARWRSPGSARRVRSPHAGRYR